MKHAYLIMTHNQFGMLAKLVELLDHVDNDIYIHVDAKAKNFSRDPILGCVKYSSIKFVEPIKIYWGESSQIFCELNLLAEATKKSYDYYHLLSGVDMPLRSQAEIHDFFAANNGRNFISFVPEIHKRVVGRVKYYHMRRGGLFSKVLNRVSITLQKICGVNRNSDLKIYKGSNWFSITDGFARFVVERQSQIRHQFVYTLCADEIFMHTYFMASPFVDTLYKSEGGMSTNCRLIRWENELPHVFVLGDFEQLLSTPNLFARKFSESVDREVIEKLYEAIKSRG